MRDIGPWWMHWNKGIAIRCRNRRIVIIPSFILSLKLPISLQIILYFHSDAKIQISDSSDSFSMFRRNIKFYDNIFRNLKFLICSKNNPFFLFQIIFLAPSFLFSVPVILLDSWLDHRQILTNIVEVMDGETTKGMNRRTRNISCAQRLIRKSKSRDRTRFTVNRREKS